MTLRVEIKKLMKASKEPKPTTRISFPQTVRLRILARCGFTCQHCGASLFEIEPHIDHIVPLAKGGTNEETNLQALCAPCNLAKGTQDDQGAKLMNRKEILDEANRLTHGDRDKNYGTPRVNHDRIAALWSVVLGTEVSAAQVALCMAQVKIARLIESPEHLDSFIDAAAYMAISGEIATDNP
jgi:hypothetical protein